MSASAALRIVDICVTIRWRNARPASRDFDRLRQEFAWPASRRPKGVARALYYEASANLANVSLAD
jgi:hypothetical protein